MRFSTALICLLLAGLALPADAHDFSAGALKILHPWARATAAGARNAICDSGCYRQYRLTAESPVNMLRT